MAISTIGEISELNDQFSLNQVTIDGERLKQFKPFIESLSCIFVFNEKVWFQTDAILDVNRGGTVNCGTFDSLIEYVDQTNTNYTAKVSLRLNQLVESNSIEFAGEDIFTGLGEVLYQQSIQILIEISS